MDIDFKFYRAILWQRLPLILMIWLVIAGAGIAVAYLLPPVYRSSARFLVEKPQIDPTLATQTVNITSVEIIQSIQQRLMTRSNMLEVADKFGVFKDERDLSPSERVQKMQMSTSFDIINLGDRFSRAPSTTMFDISFATDSPSLAAQVANEFVTRIQEQNTQIRTGRAVNTADFFEQESARLAAELTDLESQIVNFQNENSDALPNSLEFRRGETVRIQQRLLQIDTQEITLLDQKTQIERAVADPTLLGQVVPTAQQSPEEQQLTALKGQLAQLKATYSDEHHQVKQIKAQIGVLEAAIRGLPAPNSGDTTGPRVPSQLQQSLDQIAASLEFLRAQRIDLEAELERLKGTIEQTPNVSMALNVLNRRYALLQGQYDSAITQLNTAATGESIEVRQQGERFEVIEQAGVPDEPESPPRVLIALGAILGGLGAGLGIAFLLELLNKSVRRPSELVKALGIQPFATVPYIATHGEVMRGRLKTAGTLLTVAIGVPALLYIIHYQYMPIDLILSNMMERFGLDDLTRSLG